MYRIDLNHLRNTCPLPELMRRIGLGQFTKAYTLSPFIPFHKASFGIYQYEDRWMYKDELTKETGDELGLLAKIRNQNVFDNFHELAALYHELAHQNGIMYPPVPCPAEMCEEAPDFLKLNIGSEDQLTRLANLLQIPIDGLRLAQARGILRFGFWNGAEIYGVSDKSGKLAEFRCLNGENLPPTKRYPSRLAHRNKNAIKNWPLGVLEAQSCDTVGWVTGSTDLLALHHYIIQERSLSKVAPIAMLDVNSPIYSPAAKYFCGKHVRMFPQQNSENLQALNRWHASLKRVGIRNWDYLDFSKLKPCNGSTVTSLAEYNQLVRAQHLPCRRIFP